MKQQFYECYICFRLKCPRETEGNRFSTGPSVRLSPVAIRYSMLANSQISLFCQTPSYKYVCPSLTFTVTHSNECNVKRFRDLTLAGFRLSISTILRHTEHVCPIRFGASGAASGG